MHRLLQQVRSGDFDRAQVGTEMRRLGAILKGPEGPGKDSHSSET